MVCLYGTLPPFRHGKAFTLLVLQAARMKQRPHTAGGLPSSMKAHSFSAVSSVLECSFTTLPGL
jgi:hypothetical protein